MSDMQLRRGAKEFKYGNKKCWINYPFDCDSEGII